MYNESDWEVQKYGTVIDCHELNIDGRYKVQEKVYRYQDRVFVEVWCNGYRLSFSELFD